MHMKKINPDILTEWESYCGKTITTADGFTFEQLDLARRAYALAESDCQGLQDCIDRLEEQKTDQEGFRGETSDTKELGITIARLDAERFAFLMTAYRKHTWELGLGDPLGSGLLGMLEFVRGRRDESDQSAAQNDNEQGASQMRKLPRGKSLQKKAVQN